MNTPDSGHRLHVHVEPNGLNFIETKQHLLAEGVRVDLQSGPVQVFKQGRF